MSKSLGTLCERVSTGNSYPFLKIAAKNHEETGRDVCCLSCCGSVFYLFSAVFHCFPLYNGGHALLYNDCMFCVITILRYAYLVSQLRSDMRFN